MHQVMLWFMLRWPIPQLSMTSYTYSTIQKFWVGMICIIGYFYYCFLTIFLTIKQFLLLFKHFLIIDLKKI